MHFPKLAIGALIAIQAFSFTGLSAEESNMSAQINPLQEIYEFQEEQMKKVASDNGAAILERIIWGNELSFAFANYILSDQGSEIRKLAKLYKDGNRDYNLTSALKREAAKMFSEVAESESLGIEGLSCSSSTKCWTSIEPLTLMDVELLGSQDFYRSNVIGIEKSWYQLSYKRKFTETPGYFTLTHGIAPFFGQDLDKVRIGTTIPLAIKTSEPRSLWVTEYKKEIIESHIDIRAKDLILDLSTGEITVQKEKDALEYKLILSGLEVGSIGMAKGRTDDLENRYQRLASKLPKEAQSWTATPKESILADWED